MIKNKGVRFSQNGGTAHICGTPCVYSEGSQHINTVSYSWASLSVAYSSDGSREQFLGVKVLSCFFEGSGDSGFRIWHEGFKGLAGSLWQAFIAAH